MNITWPVIAIGLCLASCKPASEAPTLLPAPTAERVRADLPGVAFDFYDDADGSRPWTIEAGELRSVAVADTARREGGVRVRARVTLAAASRTIRGLLDLDYQLDGSDWRLVRVERAGPSFAVGDDGFTLYDVEGIASDSLHGDLLTLSVIARFADGEWTTPLDAIVRRVSPDDPAQSDSLYLARLGALAEELRAEWVPNGRQVRVWAPGRRARTVAIDSAEVGIDGCEYVYGWARGAADANTLGSTSSVLGGTPVRPLTGRETRALGRLASDRLAAQGHDGRRLRPTGALAADLDGDGSDELVGAFAVGADTLMSTAGIVVAARMTSNGARLLFERVPETIGGLDPNHERRSAMSLVGVTDLDADGAAEIIVREEGYETHSYRIVTFRAGRFVDAFRGGGGGC